MGMLFKDTLLGVGTPEVLVVLVVGYFVLGPIELFKFAKQAGVLLGQLKDIGLGTATNLGQIMEDQVRLLLFGFHSILVPSRAMCHVVAGW